MGATNKQFCLNIFKFLNLKDVQTIVNAKYVSRIPIIINNYSEFLILFYNELSSTFESTHL